MANGGGLIQVAGELKGNSAEEVKLKVEKIFDTVTEIFAKSKKDGISPARLLTRSPSSDRRGSSRRQGLTSLSQSCSAAGPD